MPFNIAFFSSSDFCIPIAESILESSQKNLSLLDIFYLQMKWLQEELEKNNLLNLKPTFWQENVFLEEFKNELNQKYFFLNEQVDLKLIVSQPDRFQRQKTLSNPVSQWSKEKQIPLFQPEKINKSLEIWIAKSKNLDLAILASFGQILSENVLKVPKYGFLNWHPSILPKYRGASPIQSALLNGDTQAGLSWLEMTKEMDAGDIWLQLIFNLEMNENFLNLSQKMGNLGAKTWSLPVVTKIIYFTKQQN